MLVSLFDKQKIILISGPLIQVAFVPIGYPGKVAYDWLRLNIYTTPATFSIFVYAVLFIVVAIYFNEYAVLESSKPSLTIQEATETSEDQLNQDESSKN